MDTKTYIATRKDVEQLMVERLTAGTIIAAGQNTYLRMVLATAQKRLDISVARAPRSAIVPTDEVLMAHANMVQTVHDEFYDVIKAVAQRTQKDPEDMRDLETVIASRLVFARSAYSTIRAWILRGRHSLQSIVAAKAIKREMAELTPPRESSGKPRALNATPLVRSAEAILSKIVTAAVNDKEAAMLVLQEVINHLVAGFDQLGVSSALIKDAVEQTAATEIDTPAAAPAVTRASLRTAIRRGPVRAPASAPGAGRAAVL